jgi:hypothetical protein
VTIRNAAGTVISKVQLAALTTTVVDPPPIVTVTEEIYQDYDPRLSDNNPGAKFEPAQRLLFYPGQPLQQAQIDGLFVTATATSITPATGPAAGNTPVVIKGTNLAGTTMVTFGGTNATNVLVVNNETVTCNTPAKTAGAYTVIIKDDAGDVSKAAFYTYA